MIRFNPPTRDPPHGGLTTWTCSKCKTSLERQRAQSEKQTAVLCPILHCNGVMRQVDGASNIIAERR